MARQTKSGQSQEIVQTVLEYHQASKKYKARRLRKNRFNWDIYNHKQNYAHKKRGQSKEFLPKLSLGVEALVSTIISGLTNRSDDWFAADQGAVPDEIFDKDNVRRILSMQLYNADAYAFLANAIKNAGLDAIVTAKVRGRITSVPRFFIEKGRVIVDSLGNEKVKKTKVEQKEFKKFELAIDLIDFEDFDFDPDPNPSGHLFRMHTVQRDLHELIDVAENEGVYDMDVIKSIQEEFIDKEAEESKRARKDLVQPQGLGFRKKVTIREMWGTVLDRSTGRAKEKNVVLAIANDKYLIRPPEKNPNLDGQDPFVSTALIQVPGSDMGKGFLDASAMLNKTFNEMNCLLLDGYFDAVKGIKQYRRGMVTNPRQASGGLATGDTIDIEDSTPIGMYVVEKVPTGSVPADAYSLFRYYDQTTSESMFQSELKLGGLPPASTKATVASLSDQALSGIFGGISRVFEDKFVVPVLEKAWIQILQGMESEHFAQEELVSLLGEERAAVVSAMTPEERFARGVFAAKFRVRGISSILQRLREFQKLTTVLQVISSNPDLYNDFKSEFSTKRVMSSILGSAGIREDELKLTEDEKDAQARKGKIDQLIAGALQQAKGGKANGSAPPTQEDQQLQEPGTDLQLEGNA